MLNVNSDVVCEVMRTFPQCVGCATAVTAAKLTLICRIKEESEVHAAIERHVAKCVTAFNEDQCDANAMRVLEVLGCYKLYTDVIDLLNQVDKEHVLTAEPMRLSRRLHFTLNIVRRDDNEESCEAQLVDDDRRSHTAGSRRDGGHYR